jgi:O-antigen biosynthesis protein WbqP
MSYYFFVKRLCDIKLAILLIFLLAPVYLILALVIIVQDGRPAIFRQNRIGKNGVEFLFYKFRSMPENTPNVESKETQKLQVTTFGKFIRRTNLDELPQFYNVLKGDMSFIGPRPPISTQTDLINLRRENGSIKMIPGLTGWAQVNSFDGMSVIEKAKFDGEYASKISFGFELLILFKTILYFTKKPPIY